MRAVINESGSRASSMESEADEMEQASLTPMRALNIQIQANREPTLDVDRTRRILEDFSKLKPLVESVICDEGGEHGLFLNYTYQTANLPAFWALVRERLLSVPDFSEKVRNCSTIIASKEADGWENYLLLQHFDPLIETQALS